LQAEASERARPGWAPYVVPMVIFFAMGAVESISGSWYPLAYTLKLLLVTAALAACRATWRDVRSDARVLVPAVLVGLAVLAEWIALSAWIPYPRMGARVAYDPYTAISDPTQRVAFVAVRLCGLALMVPLMEELFWRSFLLRALSSHDWREAPIGSFSWSAFWMVAVAFGGAHPEWLVAAICGIAYGLLLWRTRSVFACVVAHAVTNLGLGIYVLLTGAWAFW
jgi:uncharacterized protein